MSTIHAKEQRAYEKKKENTYININNGIKFQFFFSFIYYREMGMNEMKNISSVGSHITIYKY